MAKTLYLIAGANGSGKTTLAHELLKDEPDLVFLNADEVAAEIDDTIGIRSGKIILENIEKSLKDSKSVAMESTISGKYHERVIERFRDKKYEIVLIYVFLDSVELNIARIQKRVVLGGHGISEEVIRRRFYKSIKNFWAAAALADRWKLFYNGDVSYEIVAEGNGDVEQIMNDDLYKKFKKGLKSE